MQARPRLESAPVSKFVCVKDNSAFNLNLGCLSLHPYSEDGVYSEDDEMDEDDDEDDDDDDDEEDEDDDEDDDDDEEIEMPDESTMLEIMKHEQALEVGRCRLTSG